MSRRLDDLSPRFKPLACLFLARLMEADIPVKIVDTLRTPEEQAHNIAKGVSWTMRSKHLTGDAMDVCPYAIFALDGPDRLQWDTADPVWTRIGKIAEGCGLTWGGRWQQRDMGHVEYKEPPVTGHVA
jgi:peptidoglycan L-alanyl-D-glutamate endopeptidase CwlK